MLEEFRKEQDVSRRNLKVYTLLEMGKKSVKELAKYYRTRLCVRCIFLIRFIECDICPKQYS